jgi:hypothetical protein
MFVPIIGRLAQFVTCVTGLGESEHFASRGRGLNLRRRGDGRYARASERAGVRISDRQKREYNAGGI